MRIANKRGVIGKGISGLPVLIIVIVVVGTFLFLTAASVNLIGEGVKDYGSLVHRGSQAYEFLNREITVNIEGVDKEMLHFDLILLAGDRGWSGTKYFETIEGLIKENECIRIFSNLGDSYIDWHSKVSMASNPPPQIENYGSVAINDIKATKQGDRSEVVIVGYSDKCGGMI